MDQPQVFDQAFDPVSGIAWRLGRIITMMKAGFGVILLLARGGSSAGGASAPPSSGQADSDGGTAADCPATLNCQPPTNDKNALCTLPRAELEKRCPNTKILD
jgi:hypothetical protein